MAICRRLMRIAKVLSLATKCVWQFRQCKNMQISLKRAWLMHKPKRWWDGPDVVWLMSIQMARPLVQRDLSAMGLNGKSSRWHGGKFHFFNPSKSKMIFCLFSFPFSFATLFLRFFFEADLLLAHPGCRCSFVVKDRVHHNLLEWVRIWLVFCWRLYFFSKLHFGLL